MSAVAPPPLFTPVALREVRLYGHLGERFGRVHRLAVLSAAEAVQALCVLCKGFEAAFLGQDGRAGYHVFVGTGRSRTALTLEQAADPVSALEPIRIVPQVAGAKSGFASILLGAALMFFAPYAAGMIFAAGGPVGLAVGVSTLGVALGRALVLGGIVQLISPQNRAGASDTPANTPSYAFDGAVNSSQEGLPVPVAYGRVIVGSAVISSGLATADYADNAGASTPTTGTQTLPAEQPLDPISQGGGDGSYGV